MIWNLYSTLNGILQHFYQEIQKVDKQTITFEFDKMSKTDLYVKRAEQHIFPPQNNI